MRTLIAVAFCLLLYGQVHALTAMLNWRDNSTTEEGFDIERQLPGDGTWSLLAVVPVNITQFRDDFSLEGMCYRVRAFAGGGTSFTGYTNIACVVVTGSPSDLAVEAIQPGDLLDARMVTRDGLPVNAKRHRKYDGKIEINMGREIEMEINGQRVP